MRRESVAQVLLSIFVGHGRAASIVGDLLERDAGVGNFRFWLSVAQITSGFLWSLILAAVLVVIGGYIFLSFVPIQGVSVVLHPVGSIESSLESTILLLFITAIWCILRYRWKEALTLFTVTFLLLGSVGLFRWVRLVEPTIMVLTGGFVIAALFFRRGRRSLLALLVITVGSELLFSLVFSLGTLLAGMYGRRIMGPFEQSWLVISLILSVFLVCSISRRFFLEKHLESSSKPATT